MPWGSLSRVTLQRSAQSLAERSSARSLNSWMAGKSVGSREPAGSQSWEETETGDAPHSCNAMYASRALRGPAWDAGIAVVQKFIIGSSKSTAGRTQLGKEAIAVSPGGAASDSRMLPSVYDLPLPRLPKIRRTNSLATSNQTVRFGPASPARPSNTL